MEYERNPPTATSAKVDSTTATATYLTLIERRKMSPIAVNRLGNNYF
jgi:hypothetical protein